MRHRRHKNNIHCSTRGRAFDAIPFIIVRLLCSKFSLVELPVLIDGDR